MFIQVIQGRVSDKDGLRRQLDRWQSEVKPGAIGHLGSTSGVADDGTSIAVVRFESEEAAQKNSERAEQGAWWAETSKYFEDKPTFINSSDTDTTLGGGSNDAGFVQVMIGEAADKAGLLKWEQEHEDDLRQLRPDLIGGVRCWDGNRFIDVAYFTSEAEAREGEKKMGGDTNLADWERLASITQFIDLKDPWLF
jgi:hypothetical protein